MKSRRWFFIRALLQLLFWFVFFFGLIYTRAPLEGNPVYNLYPRLSLHLGLGTSIAVGKIITAFIPAVIIFAATLALGRFFCGFICPLGATLDVTDRVFTSKKRHAGGSELKSAGYVHTFKYMVLGISLVLSLSGIQAAGIIDPLSLSVRSYGTALYPYFDSLVKLVFNGLYHVPFIPAVTEPVFDFLKVSILDFNSLIFLNHLVVFAPFCLILALSSLARRFWCRALCPLGAMLALPGKFSLLRRTVDPERCTGCLACVRDCRMNAIRGRGDITLMSECIMCFECLKSCTRGASSFVFSPPFTKRAAILTESPSGRLSRRDIIAGTAAAAVMIPLARVNPEYKRDHAALIRPPGALPEDVFLDACIRCGACMKVCPTNALHPAVAAAGLEGLFTPRLVPKMGWCEKNCVLCTQVCPTGALRRLDISQRETEIMGTAYFLRDLCIPWAEHRDCMVCEEVCPTATKSIKFREESVTGKDGVRVRVKLPYVLEHVCIGCGICENKCPVPGSAAIRVRSRKIIPEKYR